MDRLTILMTCILLLCAGIQAGTTGDTELRGIGIVGTAIRTNHTKTPLLHYDLFI